MKAYITSLLSLAKILSLFSVLGVCPAVAEEEWVYQVASGDNLWNLGEKYLQSLSYVGRVQALNHIADPYHIPPGTHVHIPTRWLAVSQTLARVASVQGKAEVIAAGGKTSPLQVGSLLMAGDSVRTGDNSSLVLQFVDGSSLSLMANSYMTLKNLTLYNHTGMTDTRMDLQQGRLETQVAPKVGPAARFQITTPSAFTSVRGTNYRVSTEANTIVSRTEVLQGGVAVTNQGKTREIPKGFGTLTAPNQAPIAPVKLSAAPDLSAIPQVLEQVPIPITLPALVDKHAYRIQIASSSNFSQVLFDQKFATSPVRGPDLPDGDYYLRVRRIDGNGLEGQNADKPISINARPEAPFLVTPKPEAGVTEEQPYLLWAEQKNIAKYHVQIARDKSFKQLVADQHNHTDIKYAPAQPLALGTYFWRVASVDEKNSDGPFSDVQEFKRITPAPELEEPELSEQAIVIRARTTALPGQQYQFQIAKDEAFAELIADQKAQEPKITLPPQPAGTYYMRVRAIDRDGFIGPFGQTQMLDIPDGGLYYWLMLLPLLALIAL